MIYRPPSQPWYSLITAVIYGCHWLHKHCCKYKGCLPQILLWYLFDTIHFPFLTHLLCVTWGHFTQQSRSFWFTLPGVIGSGNWKDQMSLFFLQSILIKIWVSLSLDANICIKWPIKRIICIWAFFGYLFVLLVHHLLSPIHFAFVLTVSKQTRWG